MVAFRFPLHIIKLTKNHNNKKKSWQNGVYITHKTLSFVSQKYDNRKAFAKRVQTHSEQTATFDKLLDKSQIILAFFANQCKSPVRMTFLQLCPLARFELGSWLSSAAHINRKMSPAAENKFKSTQAPIAFSLESDRD